jgi:hypothetical protein
VDLIGIGVSWLLIPSKLLISKERKMQDFHDCRVGRTIFVRKYFRKPRLIARIRGMTTCLHQQERQNSYSVVTAKDQTADAGLFRAAGQFS